MKIFYSLIFLLGLEANNWPDYVFIKGYRLPALKETKRFIEQHGHLPEMPSATKVAVEGHDLGEIQIKLLKKVEELTLHVIHLEEVNEKQSKKIAKQDLAIGGLKKIISKTKKK